MYELWHGECDLIEDISMLQRNYHDSLLRLGLITQSEAEQIFGGIHSLLPIHTELKEELTKAKGTDGSVQSVGNILLKWVCYYVQHVFYVIVYTCHNEISLIFVFFLRYQNLKFTLFTVPTKSGLKVF